MIGSTLSHFKITAKLGAGGMGEVYQATDIQLDREVAIKVLPEAFANSQERLGRFKREAHLLASLNHPNIASVYEVGSAAPAYNDAPHPTQPLLFIVMELAAGSTLAERIAEGPMSLDEAISIALQIADALNAAHEHGIVHRDLKPANVKVSSDRSGMVKVLDFGLAKALSNDDENSQAETLTLSPTLTGEMTASGVILGTAAYMSPEQSRGLEVDPRTDVWAFGCLLFEILTGERAFPGRTVSDIIASILTRDPDWHLLPAAAQGQIRRVLQRCLAKELGERTRDIADVALELKDAISEGNGAGSEAPSDVPSTSSPARRVQGRRRWMPAAKPVFLALALLVALVGIALVWFINLDDSPADPSTVQRLSISAPGLDIRSTFDLSPDGKSLVYAQIDEPETRLLHRRLDQFEGLPIPGTEGGVNPFFSPDGQWIGFFTHDELKKVRLDGGPTRTITSIADHVYSDPTRGVLIASAAWGPTDLIVFSSGNWNASFEVPGLLAVPATGGEPRVLTTLDISKGESGHFNPRFLPDSRSVAFTVDFVSDLAFQLELYELDTGTRKILAENGGGTAHLIGRHLVFSDSFKSRLVAAPFDSASQQINGPRVSLVEGMRRNASTSYALSETGHFVYAPQETGGQFKIVEVSRQGTVSTVVDQLGAWAQPRLSPDGRKLVFREVAEQCNLWLLNRDRQTTTRLTFDSDNHNPVWSPDGRFVAFGRTSESGSQLFAQQIDSGLPPRELTTGNGSHIPTDWSDDGRFIAFTDQNQETGLDLWVLTMDGSGQTKPFLATRFTEHSGTFSPDATWIAYTSDETRREQVYVQPFPGPGAKIQISVAGGSGPIWSDDGSEIFFNNGDRLLSVAVETNHEFAAGAPVELFHGDYSFERAKNFSVSADGQQFVIPQEFSGETGAELRIVLNWAEELERAVSGQ